MKRFLRLSLPVLAVLGLAACNTVEGAGQDLQRAGATISEEARDAR